MHQMYNIYSVRICLDFTITRMFQLYRNSMYPIADALAGNIIEIERSCSVGYPSETHLSDVIMGAIASQINQPHDCLLNRFWRR